MAQPYKGVRIQLTSRLPADLHRALVGVARERHMSLNDVIVAATKTWVEENGLTHPVPEPVGVRHNQNIYDDDGNVIAR